MKQCTHCGMKAEELKMKWGYQPDGVTYGWRCKNLEDCLKRVRRKR